MNFPNLDQEAIRKLYDSASFQAIDGKKGGPRKLGGAVKGKPQDGQPGEWKSAVANWVYLTQPDLRVAGPRDLLVQYLQNLAREGGQTPNMAAINSVIDNGVTEQNYMSKAQVFVEEARRSKAAAAQAEARRAAEPSKRTTKPAPDQATIEATLRGVGAKMISTNEAPKEYDAEGKEIKKTVKRGPGGTRNNLQTFITNITDAMQANEAARARGDTQRVVYNVMGLETAGPKIGTNAKKDGKFNPASARDLIYVEGLPIVVNKTKSDALSRAMAAINLLKANRFEGLEPFEEAFRNRLGRGSAVTAQLTGGN